MTQSLLSAMAQPARSTAAQHLAPPPPLPPPCRAARLRPLQRRRPRLQPACSSAATLSSADEEPVLSEDEPLSDSEAPSTSAPSGGSMRRDQWRVPLPPHLHGKAPRRHWNANALAFLGDSVWEVRAGARGWRQQ